MSQYTPGPWKMATGKNVCFHEGNRVSIVHEWKDGTETGQSTIAEVWPGENGCDIADGRLIAAAPELLEALQLLYNACPAAKPPNAALWEAFKKARAVLKEIEP